MSGEGTSRPESPGLVLVGYRGTGKSTVGRLLAARAGRAFVDLDVEVEARAGRTIRAIFAETGEPAFRDLEEAVLRELVQSRPGVVLGAGGGTILRESNRDLIRAHGFVAWLRADAEELARRIEGDEKRGASRPALTGAGVLEEVAAVLEVRTPLYQRTAHAAFDTRGRTPDEVAAAVFEGWSARRDKPGGGGASCS